ncbi:diadenylate cyclase [Archaeoglobales archaeon]|nr:MAG: diadenylate cyclase [Archaeoglobales archaeon]
MMPNLIKYAAEIAKKVDSNLVVVITKDEVVEEVDDVRLLLAPRSYATMLESLFWSLEESKSLIDKNLVEKAAMLFQNKEYISTFLYFKGVELNGNAVGVFDLDLLKGILVVELDKSRIQRVLADCADRVKPEVLRAVLTIALNIAQKGREGRKIGTAFVIGDVDEVLKRSSPLIINPYKGHPEKERDITNPDTWESVMEFAQLDGIFVVREDGIIEAAGRYLEVSGRDLRIKKGLGGRHLACASITRETEAIAVVVSESGDIKVYKDGEEILEINAAIL